MLTDKQILLQAKKRFTEAMTYWADQKQKATELMQFTAGDQWTYAARQTFESAGFAAMTSNRIQTYLRQITNELMKNPPQGQVDPRSDDERKKAEVLNDMIRNIQEETRASEAYTQGVQHGLIGGIGYFRILSRFKSPSSFDKEVFYEKVSDPNTVMLDPHHQGLVGEDSEFAFITTTLSKDEYRSRYAKTKLARAIAGVETEDDLKDVSWTSGGRKWTQTNEVLINEYYFKDYITKRLCQIFDTETGDLYTSFTDEDDKPRASDPTKVKWDEARQKEGLDIIRNERHVQVPVVRWCKLNDLEVLEQTEWPGTYIPIVAIKADEFIIEGDRKLVSAVEPAVEAQVELNYSKSWLGQLLQMMPKAPYIGTAVQFKNHEMEWAQANVSNQAFLPYNGDPLNPGPPQRDTGGLAQVANVLPLVMQAQQDMQQIFGVFDPDRQNAGVESGKALNARENQSYNSNYHIYSNMARAVEQGIRILLEAIPVIYDTPRDVQLLAQDGKKKTVSINTPNEEGVVEYDMTIGEFTVSIQSGPSFGTKRQEGAENGMRLLEAYPPGAPAIVDLVTRMMDFPGADKMADSLESMVPPQVLAARKVDPENAAAMIPGLQSQVSSLTQENAQLKIEHQHMVSEMEKATNDIRVEQMKADVEIKKAELQAKTKMSELQHNEDRSVLEFQIREAELKLAEAELALKKEQLALQGISVASKMADSAHTKHVEHLDRMNPNINVPGGMDEGDNVGLSGAL